MLSNYINVALRNLKRHRTYAMLNIVGLGLSIACGILIFMVVRHHLSFDKYHSKLDRIAMVTTESRGEEIVKMSAVPYPMGAALRQEYAFLEKTAMVTALDNAIITLSKTGEASVKFKEDGVQAFADPELFYIFDFPLVAGSIVGLQEPNTAVLTEKIARKYYGTDDPIGKTFKINNKTEYRVVAVLKDIPENTDLDYQIYCSWASMGADENLRRRLTNWGGISSTTLCFALVREGYTINEFETALTSFSDKYFHPEVREWHYHAVSFATTHFDPDYGTGTSKSYIWTLSLIGLFLLITACVNFINMATAQALNRAREVGVRKVMGSTRGQLFWQFMSETGLIVLFSMSVGLVLASIGLPLLNTLTTTNLTMSLGRDLTLYGFLAALMVGVTFLSGAYPGLALSGFRPIESLKGSVDGGKAGGFSLRRLLVGSQFAISQTLIIGAVVVTAQMDFSRKADLGFRRDGIVNLPLPGKTDPAKLAALRQQLSGIAGVENVSYCMQPPVSEDNWGTTLQYQGRAEKEPWDVNIKFVDDLYLATFDLKIMAGRNLQLSDTLREYLVNEALVKKLGLASPEDVIGKTIEVDHQTFPVVGVVKNFHNHSLHKEIEPQVMGSSLRSYDVCSVRLNLQNTQPTLSAVEKAWMGVFPEFYYEYHFMDAQIADFYKQESIVLQLIRVFAGIAIFIGCLGLYGLAAFMVARKRKEIGIRKTLGASLASILWLFGKEYTRLIAAAFVLSAPLAYWVMQKWLSDFTYHINIQWWMFAAAGFVTVAIALATVGVQSMRAALINPVKSLRSE